MKSKKDESGIGVPVISRSKKKDSPKGGKDWPSEARYVSNYQRQMEAKEKPKKEFDVTGAVTGVASMALSEGQAAEDQRQAASRARLAKQKESILRGK